MLLASALLAAITSVLFRVQASALPSPSFATQLIFQAPDSLFLENIAVRATSELLITSVMSPTLHSLNPSIINGTFTPVHTFANATGLTGIAEYQPGVFAIVASVLNTTESRSVLGTVAIWSVNLNAAVPAVHKICDLPSLTGTNGITILPSQINTLLAADSAAGAVWQIDALTGATRIVIQDPTMGPGAPAPALGINGLHVRDRFLYFTNSGLGRFSRVPLTVERGAVKAAGGVQTLTPAGSANGSDDFALDAFGRAWVTMHPSSLKLLSQNANGSWSQVNVPGTVNGTGSVFVQPTSAAFGRGSSLQNTILYVTTGVGQVFRVDTRG
ncbi:hypothetical protein C8R44DRAFT_803360 [Mycena epipterygia]|nr:hypothetical protein C8R44DRAFT_803360 [Mycena epipterygia]